MEFGLGGIWMFHKVGMLGAFKNAEPPFQMAYIENIDREQKQILVSYFTYFDFPLVSNLKREKFSQNIQKQ